MSIINVSELVVAIAAGLGVAIYGLGGKSRQSTNDALQIENQSLRNQLGDATKEAAIWKTRAMKSEANEEYLKELAQSKPDFSKLSESNTKLSIQLTNQHKQILDSFSSLTSEITNMAKVIAKKETNG